MKVFRRPWSAVHRHFQDRFTGEPMSLHWYALRVKPHKEQTVHRLLVSNGDIEIFYPAVQVVPVNPRSSKERPYFPGYMFVQADLNQMGTNAFAWTPGTHGLVTFGDEPAIVPENLIFEVRHRIQQIHAAGGLVFDNLKHGDKVRIVNGPFEGYEAIFDMRLPGKDRVQVLLAFLSRYPQPVKLHVAAIEKLRV
jgi:transcription antitermination factor NusG